MRILASVFVCFSLVLFSCGKDDSSKCDCPDDDAPKGDLPTEIGIDSIDVSGDLVVSPTFSITDTDFVISMNSISNPEDPSVPIDPSLLKFKVEAFSETTTTLDCSLSKASTTKSLPVDIMFIDDTTGSMSGTVTGINSSITSFAEKITDDGIDARFCMYTYGDAFATSDGTFTVGKSDFTVPSFDYVSRPYIGFSNLSTFKSFITELGGSSVLGSGGGDGPENTLGALKYGFDKAAWRDTAVKLIIAIGDNPAHTPDSWSFVDADKFKPIEGDALVDYLKGKAKVHVVGADSGYDPYYNLKGLSDGTGGVFKALPYDGTVDLNDLEIDKWVTSSITGSCTGLTLTVTKIKITASYEGYTGIAVVYVTVK